MIISHGSVFTGETFEGLDVVIQGEEIVFVGAPEEVATRYKDDVNVVDAAGKYVVPGFVDVHFHGCMGHDFCEGTPEATSILAKYEASRGITSICPATMTYPEERVARIAKNAAAFTPEVDEASLVGINMEGPFISPQKVGAQNPAYVQQCNIDMMRNVQELSGGLFKIVDVAPEEPGALEFIREMADDVRISIAHTCATYDEAKAAFEAGAKHVTHLYNAMPGLHHREPGPIPAAVESGATPEIITDGIHIHGAMVRLAFDMFGDDRMILISDSMEATGMPDGEYQIGGQPVTKVGNRATLHSGTLAGSATDLAECLRICVEEMDIPFESALKAATVNPARAIGIDDECAHIMPGYRADIVLMNADKKVENVVLRGNLLK